MAAEATAVVSPSEYRKARLSLLEEEKVATRALDALARHRQALPMTLVTKSYAFKDSSSSPNAPTLSLSDLFAGNKQLIIYHLMFDPSWSTPCSSCSFCVDNLPSSLSHLNHRDTTFACVSRAPAEKIATFKARMGWTFPWYSCSPDESFNYDFHVTQDDSVRPIEYNFKDAAGLEKSGQQIHTKGEQPGLSCFLKGDGNDEGKVFHTYSAYARGLDIMLTTYTLLDMTKLGRQEDNKEGVGVQEFKYHDEY